MTNISPTKTPGIWALRREDGLYAADELAKDGYVFSPSLARKYRFREAAEIDRAGSEEVVDLSDFWATREGDPR